MCTRCPWLTNLACVVLQIPTVLTDVSEVQAALQHNIRLNPHLSSLVSAKILDWHCPESFIHFHSSKVDDQNSKLQQSELQKAHTNSNNTSTPEQHTCHSVGVHAEGEQTTAWTEQHRQFVSTCASFEHSEKAKDNQQHASCCQNVEQVQVGGSNVCLDVEPKDSSERLIVLAADCVWVEELVHPFVGALKAVCLMCDDAVVLFAHKERSRKVDDVMIHALQAEFTIENVPEVSGEWRGSIRIMQLVLKKARTIELAG